MFNKPQEPADIKKAKHPEPADTSRWLAKNNNLKDDKADSVCGRGSIIDI
jgi:hypothetical protein